MIRVHRVMERCPDSRSTMEHCGDQAMVSGATTRLRALLSEDAGQLAGGESGESVGWRGKLKLVLQAYMMLLSQRKPIG